MPIYLPILLVLQSLALLAGKTINRWTNRKQYVDDTLEVVKRGTVDKLTEFFE